MDLKDLQNTKFLIPLHPLSNLEIQSYYQNESRFNGVYSRDNRPKRWGLCNKRMGHIQ